jgi:hypothetical protein
MDLTIADSKILQRIIIDSLKKTIGEDGANSVYSLLRLSEIKTNSLLREINALLVKQSYGLKIKNALEALSEALASRLDVKIAPDSINLLNGGSENVSIEIINRFDVPIVLEVTVEDRDNFLPVVFNKIEGAYFNNFTSEAIVDSGGVNRFKFKIGWAGQKSKSQGTTLFVVVRSREIDGLNWVGKLRVSFSD